MINWIKNLTKSRNQLIDQEIDSENFENKYLSINDNGQKFGKKCKIPRGNIFRSDQFKSWCAYMTEFTIAQKLYNLESDNINKQEISKQYKEIIRKAAKEVIK